MFIFVLYGSQLEHSHKTESTIKAMVLDLSV